MPKLRALQRLLLMKWSTALQYRADVTLWLLAEASIPLISLAIWYAVTSTNDVALSAKEVLTYYIAIIFIKIVTDSWSGMFMARDILNGEIVQDLVRPLSVFWRRIASEIAEKTLKLIVPVIALLITIVFFPNVFTSAIYEQRNILFAALALVLAVPLAFWFDIAIGSLAFWLEDVFQIRRYKFLLEYIASGLVVPYALMPDLAQTLLSYLPFRYILALPAEILLGQHTTPVILNLLVVQIVWISVLWIAVYFLWRSGLKRYAIPGQ